MLRGSAVASLGAATFALVGCGNDDVAPTPTTAATSPSAALPSPTPTSTPQVPDPKIAVKGELILPKDVDPEADIALEAHYVVSPAVKARGKLFLFMPGAGPTPDFYKLIPDQGARNGFHAIGLSFHRVALPALCADDGPCYESSRLQAQDGQTRAGSKAQIKRANSVDGRLVKLLAYLHANRPTEGWDGYLEGSSPKWASIVVSGHSLGATQAALIAKDKLVARVAMMAGPIDHLPVGRTVTTPVPWLLGPHVTPSDRYYSFGHSADEQIDWAPQWAGLKLGMNEFGAVANIDAAQPPYGNTHILTTSEKPGAGRPDAQTTTPNHASVARDDYVPLDAAGQPKFAPVWQYMCFA